MTPLFGFFNLGAQEMLILLIIGVLLFGRKLPEVGRYLGKGIVEFKKGIKGLEDEFDASAAARRVRSRWPWSSRVRRSASRRRRRSSRRTSPRPPTT